MAPPDVTLWWVAAGHRPAVAEAVDRLGHLQLHGPSAHAFTFREAYDPWGQALSQRQRADECPALQPFAKESSCTAIRQSSRRGIVPRLMSARSWTVLNSLRRMWRLATRASTA
ncbi:MAG: DUF3291 domain-containing protein [Gammaproteobacteria bacterium]